MFNINYCASEANCTLHSHIINSHPPMHSALHTHSFSHILIISSTGLCRLIFTGIFYTWHFWSRNHLCHAKHHALKLHVRWYFECEKLLNAINFKLLYANPVKYWYSGMWHKKKFAHYSMSMWEQNQQQQTTLDMLTTFKIFILKWIKVCKQHEK